MINLTSFFFLLFHKQNIFSFLKNVTEVCTEKAILYLKNSQRSLAAKIK